MRTRLLVALLACSVVASACDVVKAVQVAPLAPCVADEVPAAECEFSSGDLRYIVKPGVAPADLRAVDEILSLARALLAPALPRPVRIVITPDGKPKDTCCTYDLQTLTVQTTTLDWTTPPGFTTLDVERAHLLGRAYGLALMANSCSAAPAWFKLGLGEWVALHPIGELIGDAASRERLEISSRESARRTSETLRTTEPSESQAVPGLSHVAVELLLESREMRQVGEFCSLLRPGSPPDPAFEQAFGIGLTRFYEEYDLARQTGLPRIPSAGAALKPNTPPTAPALSTPNPNAPPTVTARWTNEAAPGGVVIEVAFSGFAAGTVAVWEAEGRTFTLTPSSDGVARIRPGALAPGSAVKLTFVVDGQRYTVDVR